MLAGLAAMPAAAHDPPGGAPDFWRWSLEPWVLLPLAACAAAYALGVARLWRRAGRGRGVGPGECASFAAGWLVLAAALVSPIDGLGGALFSMHMVQHELLMVVAAPLLVRSRPLEAWAWALAPPWRRALGALARERALRVPWRVATEPLGAWSLHALAIWGWHAPPPFEAALVDQAVHALQHATFLLTALAFWASVSGRGGRRDAAALASVFSTMLHTGALGALLTFAPTAWYPHYLDAGAFGLTALEDQQLGGLVMWVPGGVAYLAAGVVLVAGWLSPPRAAQRLR